MCWQDSAMFEIEPPSSTFDVQMQTPVPRMPCIFPLIIAPYVGITAGVIWMHTKILPIEPTLIQLPFAFHNLMVL